MTGFESWVKMGIELGAREVLEAEQEITEDDGCYDGTWSNEDRAKAIAEILMDRWSPWKAAFTKQKDLALKPADTFDVCARCEDTFETKYLRTTPVGELCAPCLGEYIHELNLPKQQEG